jgi:UDP-N-acetylmuramoyl-L-alanyl-D-glutamate--2,6-diaminopimelate ligase
VGHFNLENILSAAGAALALGIPLKEIAEGIQATGCVPGRLERIIEGRGPVHLRGLFPQAGCAGKRYCRAAECLAIGRLITVFGCGGDRDRAKRPLMGEIAARLSDLTVITSDNPRSENPLAIIAQVEAGVRTVCTRRLTAADLTAGWQTKGYLVEPDRRAAIAAAIAAARTNDAVLIAGKGHETYQVLAEGTIPFDDRKIARGILTAMPEAGA